MRGIIYKDVCLFFRGVEKRLLIVAGAALALLLVKGGVYAGLLASVMLSMTVGVQNVLAFANEEKVEWGKYQRTLPVGGGKIVAGKYAAVLVTVLLSLAGAVALNLITFAVWRFFSLPLLGISVLLAAVVPAAWVAVSLPFCYWFGFQTAQYASIALICPIFYLVKNLEDGLWSVPAQLPGSVYLYLPLGLLAVGVSFLVSMAVSAAGYRRKR